MNTEEHELVRCAAKLLRDGLGTTTDPPDALALRVLDRLIVTTTEQQRVSVPGLRRLLDHELALLCIDSQLSEDGSLGVALARMVVLDLLRRLELPELPETEET